MAEFQEVMWQWKRRFESEKTLVDDEIVGIDALWLAMDEPEKIESMVMSWAAEHPEPVYPTWKEWLEEQCVVVHFDSVDKHGIKVKWELTNKSNFHIPADIAQKLGIEPKEG